MSVDARTFRRTFVRPLAVCCSALLTSACGARPGGSVPSVTPAARASAPQVRAATAVEIYRDPARTVDVRVEDLLARMTLDEKIGQMTQVEKGSIAPGDITRYGIGSVLSGGGGSPATNTPEGWWAMVSGFQNEALAARLGIPLIYGVDAVHGHGNLRDATVFPHNIGLGAANDPALVCRIAEATAQEMLGTGIPWSFAPVVAVVQDVRWGRTYEGYSESTEIVTSLGGAYVRCLQMPRGGASGALGALATPKHFIGDGGTSWGSSRTGAFRIDQGDVPVPEATLRERYLPPYRAAVDAGAMSVMVSFSSWRGTKMHAQAGLLTHVLKGELGFGGFIVSDWGGIDQVDADYGVAVARSINAGVDMNMVPADYVRFIDTVRRAVAAGEIPQSRVDDAVRRILRTKFRLGLFEHPMPDARYRQTVRSAEHLALAREAVSRSLVLLTNRNRAVPIPKDAGLIFLTGSGANDIGRQNGGWTLRWQGETGNTTAGTSIYTALTRAVGARTRVVYDPDALFQQEAVGGAPARADVGIVVVAEEPYAEGVGDSPTLALAADDIRKVGLMRERARSVVVVILSGRPVILDGILPAADAVVAAWLPGTEGEGITDVLFGDVPFTGRLPYTWPRSIDQVPLNINTIGAKTGCDGPLFPFGYGLTADQPSPEIPDCGRR